MNIFGAPSRYIQGSGVLDRMGEILSPLGDRFFAFGDETVLSIVGERVVRALEGNNKIAITEIFGGECCYSEIFRLKSIVQQGKAQAIVGIGGGKAADTTKALHMHLNLPIVIVPTIAATDAPTSHLLAIYDETHVIQEVLRMEGSPSIILVDSTVIAQAPVRFLVAGMGDALSTKFEAEACWESGATNLFGGKPTQAALRLGQLAYEVIREHGEEAKVSVEHEEVTPAVEKVIEANILLSGLGFESGGLATAHAIHAGFTLVEEMNQSFHGEKVAFGVLVQLVMEKRERDFLRDMIEFYRHVGLPTSLEQLGLREFRMDKIEKVAKRACQEGSYIHNMPFEVDEKAVVEAIIEANSLMESE